MAAALSLLIDAHTHLHNHPAAAAALASALRVGVGGVVCCGTHPGDWVSVAALASRYGRARIAPSFGVHPWWAASSGAPHTWLPSLRRALVADESAAVGEAGLDSSRRGLAAAPLDAQLAALTAQLSLAGELGRPVSLHCVGAHVALAAALEALLPPVGSAHVQLRAPFLAPAQQRRVMTFPAGLLLHSWGGSPGAAQRLCALADRAGVACVFSFSGGVVLSAAAAVAAAAEGLAGAEIAGVEGAAAAAAVAAAAAAAAGCAAAAEGARASGKSVAKQRRHGSSSGPLSVAAIAKAIPRPPGGAGADAIASLLRLPAHRIVFETDSPDQAFVSRLAPARPEGVALPPWSISAEGGTGVEAGAAVGKGCCDVPDGGSCINAPEHLVRVVRAAAYLRALGRGDVAGAAEEEAALSAASTAAVESLFFPHTPGFAA